MVEHDLAAVLEIENDIYAFPWTPGNFRDALRAGYSGWILRRAGETVAYAVMMQAVDEMHLLNLGVVARLQRRGYGARLLGHVLSVARIGGARRLLLEVRPSNRRAIALYENFGFTRIGVRRGYYPAAVGREDAVVFEKSLAEAVA